MTASGYTLFDTPIGACAIAWSDRGITGVWLPEATADATVARVVLQRPGVFEAPAPAGVQRAIDAIVSLLRGDAADLSCIALDMTAIAPFRRRVYDAARAIPPGRTITYGDLAAQLAAPGSARAVGQALGHNPFPIIVPCHRVLAARGGMGGFSAPGGVETKRRLLENERVQIEPLPQRPVRRRGVPPLEPSLFEGL